MTLRYKYNFKNGCYIAGSRIYENISDNPTFLFYIGVTLNAVIMANVYVFSV
jgi:hypothetical protein